MARRPAKPAASLPPLPGPASRPSWLEVVRGVFAVASQERWRFSPGYLETLPQWREIVTLWPSVADSIPARASGLFLPAGLESFDERSRWAWSSVWPYVDAAAGMLIARVSANPGFVARQFVELCDRRIIHPDGSVAPRLLDRLTAEDRVQEAASSARLNDALARAMEAAARVARANAAISAATPPAVPPVSSVGGAA